MRTRFDRALETRRIYRFEGDYFRRSLFSKSLKMQYLRSEAIYIWRRMKFNKEMPNIKAGKGVINNGYWYSYYQEDVGIVLSRSQRNIITLVHELVHALGYGEHDHRFTKQYFKVLEKCYGLKPDLTDWIRYYYKLP